MKYEEVEEIINEVNTLGSTTEPHKVYEIFEANNISKLLWRPLYARVCMDLESKFSYSWVDKLYPDNTDILDEMQSLYKIYDDYTYNNKAFSGLKEIYHGNVDKLKGAMKYSDKAVLISNRLYEYSLIGEDMLLSYLIDLEERYWQDNSSGVYKALCSLLPMDIALDLRHLSTAEIDFLLCTSVVMLIAVIFMVHALIKEGLNWLLY